ncbi:MAG: DUF2214 family protein, partial [Candidatus Rokubacteria bacterium]|nr:DUF2214 family protein [Candidatus Rokubacteria bacterium]
MEKGAEFYLGSRLFRLKLGLFALVFLLEAWPMATLIRWRLRRQRGAPPDTARRRDTRAGSGSGSRARGEVGAGRGSRTPTGVAAHQILSLARLPVP